MSSPRYITTPIYYVNAPPHLGTFYTTVVADTLARYHRARFPGEGTFFLTGLDEHGQKIERMARAQGVEPQAYCDSIAAQFKTTWQRAGISYDRFIRTTDLDHRTAVQEMWNRMAASGDIYPAEYEGLYCVGCEDWKNADEVIDIDGKASCPIHRNPVEKVKEKNYFFRLSRYRDWLIAHYEAHPHAIRPESRYNEVLSFLRGEVRDVSVSRTSVKWGIPVPNDPDHTIYVWLDALTNYLTALGGPQAVQEEPRAQGLWSSATHLIAKDIVRFHAVYWPAMLRSAGLPPPQTIYCHGYLTVKGQKISKSLPATKVDPNVIADALGMDPLRYFVLREYTFGADGDFTYEALFQRYESDLGNDLGNLLNRTVAMAASYFPGERLDAQPFLKGSALRSESTKLLATLHAGASAAETAWQRSSPSQALAEIWTLVRSANSFIEQCAPWKLAKANRIEDLKEVLCNCCAVIRTAALLAAPAMPAACREILRQIGRLEDEGHWLPLADGDHIQGDSNLFSWPGGLLAAPRPVFPRIDPDRQKMLIAQWMGEPPVEETAVITPPAPAAASPGAASEISLDDFIKMDLRAARVLTAERVPKTDKLLKLTLDLGTDQRTVVSGIADAYPPEALIGKTVVYLANLKPAKLRGIVSQGMILAAGDAKVLALTALDQEVAPGTKIR